MSKAYQRKEKVEVIGLRRSPLKGLCDRCQRKAHTQRVGGRGMPERELCSVCWASRQPSPVAPLLSQVSL